ncbi:MAG: hypothetical protein IPN89_19015 [Saprospiraceae bacterium]|nr:hypothetical protein [Saprospiraceae bacterium]
MNNAQKIIDKIKGENIQPRPEWSFASAEYIKWGAFMLFISIGSISFSIILFAISVNGFDMLQHFKHSKLESILVILPILWLATLILFLGGSIVSIMHTGRAYKYSFGKWVGLSTGISIAIGTLFFITGGAKWLEHKFETNIESYESIQEKKTAIWSQPELGTLSGEIVEVAGDTLYIKDFKSRFWTIDISSAFIAPKVVMETTEQIKLNGKKTGDAIFKADQIKPWEACQ